jgi:hypothetical protein
LLIGVGELLVIVGDELVELVGLVVEFLGISGFRARLLARKLVVLVIGGVVLVVELLVVLHAGAVLIFGGKFWSVGWGVF